MRVCVADVELDLTIECPREKALWEMADGNLEEEFLDNRIWCKQEKGTKEAVETVYIYPLAQLPRAGGQVIWESDTCTVRGSGDVEVRIYHDGIIKQPYAIYSEGKDRGIRVFCEEDWLRRNYRKNYLFNVCALEKRLIQKQRIVFHSCYIRVQEKGILFSGDSGIGKSTQGSLWETYARASVVNGDRSVLGKCGEKWYVYGFPFSGTSGICKNITSPLHAIIFLKQAKDNHIRRLEAAEAVRLLWPQMTVNQWNPEFVDMVLNQINVIAEEVPIYELSCTPDIEAVTCAREMLQI